MNYPKRNLFVCLGNVDRSPAGEGVYFEMLRERGFKVGPFTSMDVFDIYVGSAGIEVSAQNAFNGSVQLTSELACLADRIFSVDDAVTLRLRNQFGVRRDQIVQLDIEDGRSLLVPDQARSLFEEYRRKLADYVPERNPR